ncbi:transcriptional regulator [Marine Group I thaumarchaeote]|uniref:Transcriptional regulator n=1 Tax=Marine Group I thaumarchaeote TaxID=2511932 RepID=A0A7K4MQP9_9ARCH|nr:transcriptional regulator [Marine Group I thaumarchaeote]
MGNDKNVGVKKEKGIRKLTDRISFWKAKSQADEEERHSPKPKPKLKKIQAKTKQAKNKKFQVIEAQSKPKEAKKKEVRIKAEAQRKAKEEAKRKEEEAKKKEEEAKRTYEEELEEQLSEEEITGFQLEKTDMDKMCNRVCEIIAGYETNGTLQSELWKKLKLSSRDGSRLALKLERMGMITREKILEKERWTYKLIIKKIPVSTKSIEGAPCLTCPVQSKCSIDGEISPKTCQWIEDWVMIELKNK